MSEKSFRKVRVRIVLVSACLFCLFAAGVVRLYQVHIVWNEKLTTYSERQYYKTLNVHTYRGTIYDRASREMAVSVEAESVYANPHKVQNVSHVAEALSHALGVKKVSVLRALNRKRKFSWIERKVSPASAEKIEALQLKGIGFVQENKRFYPNRELAARTVGFVGIDNQGLAGLEYHFDEYIRADLQKRRFERDALGRGIGRAETKIKKGGYDLYLTIDKVIQFIAEKELKKQVEATGATGGVVIVMDPITGDVLAMADQPQFNPNEYRKYDRRFWSNKAVSHLYEPGSTFKMLVAAAAIEYGILGPDDLIDCENGVYAVGGIKIHEANHKKLGTITFRKVLSKSSNIGAVKIGEMLTAETLHSFMKMFGIGTKTGIDLPAESKGIFHDTKKWSGTTLAAVSFGQEVSVTPIQLITAVSAIANGGFLLKPIIVREIRNRDEIIRSFPKKIIRRVLSRETSQIMTELLEYAVEHGTGKRARIDGFKVAGKTGTSQKAKPGGGGYSKDKFISSFAGYVSSEGSPLISILVVLDEPKTAQYGGQVAAPVFKKVALQTLRYLKIPSSNNKVYKAESI